LDDGSGHSALAYGLIIGVAKAKGDANEENALNNATNQVIQDLQKSNPGMKITRQGRTPPLERPARTVDLSEQFVAGRGAGNGLGRQCFAS